MEKKVKKGCAVLLSTAMVLTAAAPFAVSAAEETAALQYESTLAADGTITTTVREAKTSGTAGKAREFFYTADNRICREFYSNQFSVAAAFSDAATQKELYKDQYTICTDTEGVCYFAAKDADTFGYENGQQGDSKLSYDACKTLAAELLRTGSTNKVTISQSYYDLDKAYYPSTGTVYVNGEDVTVDAFSWVDADITVSAEKLGVALTVPSAGSDDVTWTRIYDTMKHVLEKMPAGTSVMFQPYMYNTIVTERAYNPCEIVQEAEANTKGDIDGDDTVTIADAFDTLMYHSKQSVGASNVMFTKSSDILEESGTFAAADIDHDGEITIQDAYQILLYSSYQSAGKEVDWAEIG